MTTVPYAAKLLVRAEKVPSNLLECREFNSKLGIHTKKIFSSYLQGRVAFTLCLYHMSKNWRTKSVKSFSHSLHWSLYRHLSRACVYIYMQILPLTFILLVTTTAFTLTQDRSCYYYLCLRQKIGNTTCKYRHLYCL